MKIGIVGAGSVGIHYARAWSKAGAQVTLFDNSNLALDRLAETWFKRYSDILPSTISTLGDIDRFLGNQFDFVIIGTPPEFHLEVFRSVHSKMPEVLVEVQKPFLPPNPEEIREFLDFWLPEGQESRLISGYNYRFSSSFRFLLQLLKSSNETVEYIGVNWQESWQGPLSAHYWLKSIEDSYLGHSLRGGGAGFEHSHGLELAIATWLHLGIGRFEEHKGDFEINEGDMADSAFCFEAENSLNDVKLRVVQSALPGPTRKCITIRTRKGLEISLNFASAQDELVIEGPSRSEKFCFGKNREEDFDAVVRGALQYFRKIDLGGNPFLEGRKSGMLTLLYLTESYLSKNGTKIFDDSSKIQEMISKAWSWQGL